MAKENSSNNIKRLPNSPAEKRRTLHILTELDRLYPEPASELNFINDFQLVIAVVLSAQCTDKKVNQVTPTLFEKFPDFDALSKASLTEVESIIRPINYYKTKSRHLIALADKALQEFSGKVPRTHESLRSLPGVGQKTANVVLGELGAAQTFPVDTHVFRVSKRLGFASATTTAKVEEELKQIFEPHLWRSLHHWFILHGRRVCKAQNPDCDHCQLRAQCPSRI